MLEYIDINSVLFLDIETAPMTPAYEDMDETFQKLWKYKSRGVLKKYDEEITDEDGAKAFDRAGIYAEFGKIICISVGVVGADKESGTPVLRLKSFIADEEAQLLTDFAVSDATWEALDGSLEPLERLDVLALVGFYVMVGGMANALRFAPDP